MHTIAWYALIYIDINFAVNMCVPLVPFVQNANENNQTVLLNVIFCYLYVYFTYTRIKCYSE